MGDKSRISAGNAFDQAHSIWPQNRTDSNFDNTAIGKLGRSRMPRLGEKRAKTFEIIPVAKKIRAELTNITGQEIKPLARQPCTSRWPQIGDRVQYCSSEKWIGHGWNLGLGAIAVVALVNEYGDFKLRNPEGTISSWFSRKFFEYCENQPAPERARSGICALEDSSSEDSDGVTKELKFYSAWFCPYAQRAWITLNYVGAPYRKIESFEADSETRVYAKKASLLAINPKGLVPTVQTPDGEVVTESIDVVAWLGKKFGASPTFYSAELLELAKQANTRICSPYYRVLMREDAKEREDGWAAYVEGLKLFASTLQGKAAFFQGSAAPTMVDVIIFPWVQRRFILEHYRGLHLEPPRGEPIQAWIQALLAWQKRMEGLECVKATLQDREKMIQIYAPYADSTATSVSVVGEVG